MTPTELAQIEINLRAVYERGKTGEALAAARRLVGDRRAGRGMSIEPVIDAPKLSASEIPTRSGPKTKGGK